jgi:aspartate ammonia-lyase
MTAPGTNHSPSPDVEAPAAPELDSPTMQSDLTTRSEHDLLGYLDVPASAYYGVHTLRASQNFPISGKHLSSHPLFIQALAAVKQAAATANVELGLVSPEKGRAIVEACEEICAGALHDEFIVDMIQGGAGTSTNMNINEVVANRALELLGAVKGDYSRLHPLQDVNSGQSTNDVYPTAIKIALDSYIQELQDALSELQISLEDKAEEFADVIKMGRTQLQDAVPMTLGQEFAAFAATLGEDRLRLDEGRLLLHELNLGGTAIGTELNSHPGYRQRAVTALRNITGIQTLISAPNLIEATQDVGVFVQLSGILKRVAVKLSKTCNDLRLLSSGPRAGFNEINLPPVQAGSSIMPGKVNPVIPEVVNQVAFKVIGNDVTVTLAAEGGQLQLNAFEPIIAESLFSSLMYLTHASRVLAQRCISGISANRELLNARVLGSIGLVTALSPRIGYEAATRLAQEALETGKGVIELAVDSGLLKLEELNEILAPASLVGASRKSE